MYGLKRHEDLLSKGHFEEKLKSIKQTKTGVLYASPAILLSRLDGITLHLKFANTHLGPALWYEAPAN